MSKLPPVPPKSRSPKGPGEPAAANTAGGTPSGTVPNPDKQGQQGNSKENTTHQGNQQDR